MVLNRSSRYRAEFELSRVARDRLTKRDKFLYHWQSSWEVKSTFYESYTTCITVLLTKGQVLFCWSRERLDEVKVNEELSRPDKADSVGSTPWPTSKQIPIPIQNRIHPGIRRSTPPKQDSSMCIIVNSFLFITKPKNPLYEQNQMENNNRTLKELATPDVLYQPWCIQYPQLEST
ncbi:hypothetical protein CR513_02104, partial [Mucuna pruriens]